MIMVNKDEEVEYTEVYRSLSAKVYRLQFYFIKLTDSDLLICLFTVYLLMLLFKFLGIEHWQMFGLFALNPGGWMCAGTAVAIVLSLGHKLRPEGNSDKIIRNLFEKKHLAARSLTGDQRWKPVNSRLLYNKKSK